MAQDVILNILKKHNRYLTTMELAELTGLSRGSIATNCKKLRKTNFIKFKRLKNQKWGGLPFAYKINNGEE